MWAKAVGRRSKAGILTISVPRPAPTNLPPTESTVTHSTMAGSNWAAKSMCRQMPAKNSGTKMASTIWEMIERVCSDSAPGSLAIRPASRNPNTGCTPMELVTTPPSNPMHTTKESGVAGVGRPLVLIQISLVLPGSPVWPTGSTYFDSVGDMQRAFESVFTLPGILIFGSMTAYLVAQLMDVRLFHFWKSVTKGKHLWIRNNASTMMSQMVDTIIVNSIFLGFGLGLDWGAVSKIVIASYIFKVLMAAVDTPFIYLGVHLVRRYAGGDQLKAAV